MALKWSEKLMTSPDIQIAVMGAGWTTSSNYAEVSANIAHNLIARGGSIS